MEVSTRLPKIDSAVGRGVVTAAQSFVAALVIIGSGVIAAIVGVPGCSGAILDSLKNSSLQIAATFGVSTGLVSFAWNAFVRKDVRNY